MISINLVNNDLSSVRCQAITWNDVGYIFGKNASTNGGHFVLNTRCLVRIKICSANHNLIFQPNMFLWRVLVVHLLEILIRKKSDYIYPHRDYLVAVQRRNWFEMWCTIIYGCVQIARNSPITMYFEEARRHANEQVRMRRDTLKTKYNKIRKKHCEISKNITITLIISLDLSLLTKIR